MTKALIHCGYCEKTGDFLADGFEQIVLKYEEGYDWTGRLEVVCKSCAEKFRSGEITQTPDGLDVFPPEMRLAVVQAWQFANDEVSMSDLWKKKFAEGTRWVKDAERVARETEERRKLNALLVERIGMTLHQLRKKRFLEALNGADPVLKVFAYIFRGKDYGE
jgi:hypothetical protein